jgi:two-component system, chemotaxis family, protein-glutamate methylesterase/glutaminase
MSKAPSQGGPRPVEILVVDDSAVVRQALKAIIEAEPGYRASTASDPYEAVAALSRSVPAAIVLDVDMPRMDGLTFLRKLMRQHPLPVLLCTNHPSRGVAALELGALEVIAKPDWNDASDLGPWGARLRESLRNAVGLSAGRDPPQPAAEPRHGIDAVLPRAPFVPHAAPGERVIAVGASTGGVQAIKRLLAGLPGEAPGVVIVQHMPGGFTAEFARQLDRDPNIALDVAEARPNEPIRRGAALVVPGHAHGLVRRAGAGYRVELGDGPPVSRHRPSVDVLFRSVAQAAGPRAAGVLLTGMQDDGARGLLELHEVGGWTIAQDEATCAVFGMPREAIRRGAARHVLPLDRIAASLLAWDATPGR